ncbi:MAG: hypothetical protein NTX03_12690 [Bacteroidetes bacterium]|nr:hypothetical protein [Bacteroidota bacterium]
MNTEKLSSAFFKIQNEVELEDYQKVICNNIISHQNTLTPDRINDILSEYNVQKLVAKKGLLNLILQYINIALEDNILTHKERRNIELLKMWFSIKESDFWQYTYSDIENIITYQLKRIYLDDYITEEEALFKVDLQDIFDLSFDQMNDLVKNEAITSLKHGADALDLDCYFTPKEYFRIKSST